jgi:hypothetical protein
MSSDVNKFALVMLPDQRRRTWGAAATLSAGLWIDALRSPEPSSPCLPERIAQALSTAASACHGDPETSSSGQLIDFNESDACGIIRAGEENRVSARGKVDYQRSILGGRLHGQ